MQRMTTKTEDETTTKEKDNFFDPAMSIKLPKIQRGLAKPTEAEVVCSGNMNVNRIKIDIPSNDTDFNFTQQRSFVPARPKPSFVRRHFPNAMPNSRPQMNSGFMLRPLEATHNEDTNSVLDTALKSGTENDTIPEFNQRRIPVPPSTRKYTSGGFFQTPASASAAPATNSTSNNSQASKRRLRFALFPSQRDEDIALPLNTASKSGTGNGNEAGISHTGFNPKRN